MYEEGSLINTEDSLNGIIFEVLGNGEYLIGIAENCPEELWEKRIVSEKEIELKE